MDSKRPSRGRWQFSLKSLLLLTLLVAAFFAGKASSDKKLADALEAEREARERAEIRMQAARDRARAAAATAEHATVRAQEARDQALVAEVEARGRLGFFKRKILEEQQARERAEFELREAKRARAESP